MRRNRPCISPTQEDETGQQAKEELQHPHSSSVPGGPGKRRRTGRILGLDRSERYDGTADRCIGGLSLVQESIFNLHQYDYIDREGIQRNAWTEWLETWPQDYAKYAEELSCTPFKRILFHDIIPSVSRSVAQELAKRVGERKCDNGVIIISFHPESEDIGGDCRGHVHFVHDCNYHQSYCRCACTATLGAFNLRFKKRSHGATTCRPSEQCSKIYIYFLLSYLSDVSA